MHRSIHCIILAVLALGLTVPAVTADKEEERLPNRPKVAGKFRLTLRERKEATPKSGKFQVVEKTADWDVAETAIIVCDMWDDLYCKSAAQRVGVMVPKMNAVLTAARNHGAMIIHAPSDTMNMYAETPYRKRMQQAKAVKPPVPIAKWCYLDETREPPMPVDTSKCACDDALLGPIVKKYTREHAGLDILSYDGISDNGEEIFNFCEQEGIKNIMLMGVHTNMCVLGRPFGIRQMVRLGKNVVLARDLTDAMYDPRQPPFVSHTRGTELVIEHIEKYWCPSIASEDLMRVVEGSAGPAADRTSAADPKTTLFDELDKLPVGLKVVHDPSSARASLSEKDAKRGKHTWWYKTTVSAVNGDVRIVEFGSLVWKDGKWMLANFTGKPFSGKDFADWYSCPDGLVKTGKSFSDPKNWGAGDELKASKARWYFIGVDGKGNRVKGEAVVEQQAELDKKPE